MAVGWRLTYPDSTLPWPIPLTAVNLIADFEQGPRGGVALRTYLCSAGVPTIGWGETATDKATPGGRCTKEQADRWLLEDITQRTAQVRALLKRHADPYQLGAMVSLAYNIGVGAFAKSTVLKAFNRGDLAAAGRAFRLWNKAKVKGVLTELPGLTRRRAAEEALFLTPDPETTAQELMPQAVATESSMAASPIAQAGTLTAGAGVVSVLAEAGAQLGTVTPVLEQAKGAVQVLGVPPEWILPALLLAAGGLIVWHRWKQRTGGWA